MVRIIGIIRQGVKVRRKRNRSWGFRRRGRSRVSCISQRKEEGVRPQLSKESTNTTPPTKDPEERSHPTHERPRTDTNKRLRTIYKTSLQPQTNVRTQTNVPKRHQTGNEPQRQNHGKGSRIEDQRVLLWLIKILIMNMCNRDIRILISRIRLLSIIRWCQRSRSMANSQGNRKHQTTSIP